MIELTFETFRKCWYHYNNGCYYFDQGKFKNAEGNFKFPFEVTILKYLG